MDKFPIKVLRYRIANKGLVYDHVFCAHCGRELTKFSFKTGKLTQQRHYICLTEDSIQLHYCWWRDRCEQRRAETKRRKQLKGNRVLDGDETNC